MVIFCAKAAVAIMQRVVTEERNFMMSRSGRYIDFVRYVLSGYENPADALILKLKAAQEMLSWKGNL